MTANCGGEPPSPDTARPETDATTPGAPRVILVGPRGGANVGSVCRAIKNMGAGPLYIVDAGFDSSQARRMAVHGRDVLENRVEVQSLEQAIEGCGLVVGTTTRTGAYRARATAIREEARELVRWENGSAAALESPFALVFGREDSGLSNDEIAACHRLAYIPAHPDYRSMNLAQAVLVSLYEVHMARLEFAKRDGSPRGPDEESWPAAEASQIEAMFADLEDCFERIGFVSTDNPKHIMASIRSILSRGGLDERELRVLRGLARQIRWFADGGREVAEDKRRRGAKLR